MASRIAFFVTVMALVHSQVFGQLCQGTRAVTGGYAEMVRCQSGVGLWGSISQQHQYPKYQSPVTYDVGGKYVNSQGHGVSGSATLESGVGGQGSVRGDFPILNSPVHKVDGFAKIQSNLNKHLNPLGPQTDTFGINYKNADGATASFSQTQTHGNSATKTIGASIPLVNSDSHLVKITGQNVIGQKQTVGVKYENKDIGATVSLSGTQPKVGPARGTAGLSILVSHVGPATVSVEGQSTFGHGMKPDSHVGVELSIPLN